MSPETPRFTKIKYNFQIIFEIPTKKFFRLSKNAPKMGRNHNFYSFSWFFSLLSRLLVCFPRFSLF
jgi:hypothetical protein